MSQLHLKRYLTGFVTALLLFACVAPAAWAGHGKQSEEKTGILLVAFGSSIPEAQVSFHNIQNKVEAAFPGIPVYWAYTSHIIRHKMAQESGAVLLSPSQALATMADEGFTKVAVQSLHTIPGEEYENLLHVASAFHGLPDGIAQIVVGKPLLYLNDDMEKTTNALLASVPAKRTSNEAVVFMGHGTHHPANVYYLAMQRLLELRDPLAFVGTVEGTPTLDDVIAELNKNKVKNVWLMPFMSVAGDHARNDMAGEEADSWKSILESKGFQCKAVLKGTAEYDHIVAIWVDHLKAAMQDLK